MGEVLYEGRWMDGKTCCRHTDRLRHLSGVNSNVNGTDAVVLVGSVSLPAVGDELAFQDGSAPGPTEEMIVWEDVLALITATPALGDVEPIQSLLPLWRSARSNLGIPPDRFT